MNDATTNVATPVDRTADNSHERKRRQIIETAAEVFAERGFVAGTTKEIAARIGLSQPAIYHYVGSKEVLLTEIAMQVDRDMKQALSDGLASGTTPREQLRGLIHAFVDAVIDNRVTFAVYYKELHALPAEIRETIAADERDFVAGFATLVAKLQHEGVLPADRSTLVIAEGLVGMVSWVHRWYRPSGPLNAESIADHFLSLINLS